MRWVSLMPSRAMDAPALNVGDVILRIDPRYFRPAEVETLLGDPTKAKDKLGWVPQITAEEMCAEMVAEDLKVAKAMHLQMEWKCRSVGELSKLLFLKETASDWIRSWCMSACLN